MDTEWRKKDRKNILKGSQYASVRNDDYVDLLALEIQRGRDHGQWSLSLSCYRSYPKKTPVFLLSNRSHFIWRMEKLLWRSHGFLGRHQKNLRTRHHPTAQRPLQVFIIISFQYATLYFNSFL